MSQKENTRQMETSTFFPGTSRRITLGSPTLQTSNRLICIPISMPLTGESFVGMPDWVGNAYEQVAKFFSHVDPEMQQITDVTLHFSNDKPSSEMFAAPSAKVPAANLRKFEVLRVGETENPDGPDVEMHFKAYAPFTRDFWAWIGEMPGEEVYMAFPSSLGGKIAIAPKQTDIDEVAAEESKILADDSNPPADAPPTRSKNRKSGKNGPQELKAFHENEVAKGRSVN